MAMSPHHASATQDHLTEYERAICYYTLPKVTSTTTIGLLAAYLVCLLEAAGVLLYGLIADRPTWFHAGVIALGAIVIFGVVAFFARALYHEIRQRKLLRQGDYAAPQSPPPDDLPDPFGDHLLIRHPRYVPGDSFACTDNEGKVVYNVDSVSQGAWWKVSDADGNEVVRVRVASGVPSFSLSSRTPGRLAAYQGDEEIARIAQRFSLSDPVVEIRCFSPVESEYVIRRRAIYHEGRLAGRIYYLRQFLYLDVQKDDCHPAILAYFVTMA
jgi:hypothetical protein